MGLRQARRSLRRPDIARAAAEAALVLISAGRTPEARACAHEALETWTALEAEAETAWVRAQLRDVGLVVGVRGQRARPKSGWESLTVTEIKVARLAAEGRSNPEIAELLVVSRRTIQTHIGNVLAKLGIASRRDLVLAAAEDRLEQLGGETA
jgi:DNA-binding CsgD family transcriptional regulator